MKAVRRKRRPLGSFNATAATAAARFLTGAVVAKDDRVNALMWDVLISLARGGAGIEGEICASVALSLAKAEVPQARFDKDGFAPRIERKPRRGWEPTVASAAAYAKFAKQLSRKRMPSVGVLKEG